MIHLKKINMTKITLKLNPEVGPCGGGGACGNGLRMEKCSGGVVEHLNFKCSGVVGA